MSREGVGAHAAGVAQAVPQSAAAARDACSDRVADRPPVRAARAAPRAACMPGARMRRDGQEGRAATACGGVCQALSHCAAPVAPCAAAACCACCARLWHAPRMLSALRAAARGALAPALRCAPCSAPPPPAAAAAAAAQRGLATSRPARGIEDFLNEPGKHGDYPKAGTKTERNAERRARAQNAEASHASERLRMCRC
jgi:hypothetical protein